MGRLKTPINKHVSESIDCLLLERLADPCFLVAGKKGKGVGANAFGSQDGINHPACRTDMCTDKFH